MNQHPNYEIFEELGRGSTATVYRAHDLSLKRDVAIKELSEKLRKDPRRLQDFWEEAQFLASLRHENIVQIHAIDRERGWIIMELMKNSLDNLTDTKGLPSDLVRSVLQQAFEGLKALHERNKLHAGIRPASLLIDDQGRIKLSDSAGITVGGEFRKPAGSSKYLAPELVNPQFGEVGPGLDLYNLGFAALELLLGTHAFEKHFKGVGPGAVDPEIGWMRWHSSTTEKLPPIRELLPQLPEDMRRVLERLTRKEVNQRYATAAEALEDLESRDLVLVREEDRNRKAGRRSPDGPAVVAVGAAPPPPPMPPPPPPGHPRSGPTPKTRPTAAGPRPWSKDWINLQLKKPYVLIPLLLLILLPVAYVLFFTGGGSPAPKPSVKVTIDSTPRGAKVKILVDGKWMAAKDTKSTFSLPTGDYKIKLELPRYKTLEESISVAEDKSFAFKLVPEAGPIASKKTTLKSDPSGADIYIDGKKLDKVTGDEITAPSWPYKLKLVYKDRTLFEGTIRNAEEEGRVFTFEKPAPRMVEIRSNPPEAYVYLNGVKQDKVTPGRFEVASAPLDIVLKKEGFKDFHKRYDALPENLPEFKLEPGPASPTTRLVYIGSDPEGATVYINEVKQPKKTPATFEVPVGPFKLRLERGKRLVETTVAKGETKVVSPLPPVLRPLYIETKPAGASVFVDGVKQAKVTNDTFMVPDEPFNLRLEGPGDVPGIIAHSVAVTPDSADSKLTHSFLRKMYLSSKPSGATVFINDIKQAKKTNDTFEVPAVAFNLKLELEDRRLEVPIDPKKVDVKTDPGSKVPVPLVELELPPPAILIALKTTPVGAQIVITTKEKAIKETGPTNVRLPEGVYPIEVRMKGFATYRGKLEIAKDTREKEFILKELTPTRYALLVGVRDYGAAVPDFLHAESDAESLADVLRAAEFSAERVFALTQAQGKSEPGLAPTRKQILDKLKFLADTCTEADTVWVALFGQVISTKEGDFFWPDKGDRSRPDTLVPMAEVLAELKRCPAEAKVLLMDGWRHSFADGIGEQPHAIREYRPRVEDLHGTIFLASTQPGQTGYDHLYKRHGLFGAAVLRAVAGLADQNGDDKISGSELDAFVRKEVIREAKTAYNQEQSATLESPGAMPGSLIVSRVTPALKNYGLALTKMERGDAREALNHLEKSLEANAQFIAAFVARGEASFVMGNRADAIKDWNVVVKLNPNCGQAWSHLGDAQFELKDPEAFNSHTRAIETEPGFALGYRDRGFLYLKGVEVDKRAKRFKTEESEANLTRALEDLRKATRLNTRLDLAWHDYGRACMDQTYAGMEQYEPAIQAFGKAVETSTTQDTKEAALFERAEAFRLRALSSAGEELNEKQREDLRNSLKDYTELATFKVKDLPYYYNMQGSVNERLGNLKEAAASFENATRLKMDFKEAYLNLGAVYNKLAEYDKAIPALERAIKLDRSFGRAHAYLYASYTFRAKNELDPARRESYEARAAEHYKEAKKLGAIP